MRTLLTCFILLCLSFSCKNNSESNLDAPVKHERVLGLADAKAEVLADKIMTAMGGQSKWDSLHFISWTFFGSRKLVWDKLGGRVRIESPRDTTAYLLDLNTMKGKFSKNGIEVKDSAVVAKRMKRAKSIWINDSYWLVMPFKLRDPGVNLKYIREDTIAGGGMASVLELTFDGVGDTPQNKYEVYVDKNDNLIKQWDFYREATSDAPPRSWPWDNYKDFNGLLISTDRSDESGPSEVKVYDTMDDKVFEEF